MSPRWIIISFFMIGGGVAIALAALVAAWVSSGTLDPAALGKLLAAAQSGEVDHNDFAAVSIDGIELAMALAYGAGAALGGFFASRASRHRSFIEPAIAAALVVGSFLLVIYSTPMGKLAVSLTRDNLERLASILAATGIVAALVGATLGELASFATERVGTIRQAGVSILITIGAVWLSAVLHGLLFANEIAAGAMKRLGAQQAGFGDGPLIEVSAARVISVAASALILSAIAAGFVAQIAARRRAVAAITIAGVLVFGGIGAASGLIPQVSADAVGLIATLGGLAGGTVAGLVAWGTWWLRPWLGRRKAIVNRGPSG